MKNKNKKIIIFLSLILMFMAIGFASFSQRLNITGSSTSDSIWNVYIKSAEFLPATCLANTSSTFPNCSNNSNITGNASVTSRDVASLTTSLTEPGDIAMYKITVKNDGNVDAIIEKVSAQTKNPSSVIDYYILNDDLVNTNLEKTEVNALEEMFFYVAIKYNSSFSGTLEEEQKTNGLTLELNFVQKNTYSSSSDIVSMGTQSINLVTTGDGLYSDPVESERYVYKGEDPDNYIKLGEELYRIVSIEKDGAIKVMKNDFLTSSILFSSTKRVSEYCFAPVCNIYGNKYSMYDSLGNLISSVPSEQEGSLKELPEDNSSLNEYLNNDFYNSLTEKVKTNIISHFYDVGPLDKVEGQTLGVDSFFEKEYKWKGLIGLISATDYIKASTNDNCNSIYDAYSSPYSCKEGNYLYKNKSYWTLTPRSDFNGEVIWIVYDYGKMGGYYTSEPGIFAYPTFYLNGGVILKGNGKLSSPFEIM